MRHWHRIALLLLATTLTACGSQVPTLPPLSKDATLLAFGDSITYGTGATRDESYPALLARLIDRQVVNAGIPGEESAQGLARLPALLDKLQPELLLLCHGGNDLLRKRDRTRLKENLRAMIAAAHARGVTVILIGVPRPKLLFMEAADVYPQLAEELALPFAGTVLPRILADNDLKADAIHPNAAGYTQLAEAIAQLLRETGALEGERREGP